MPQGMGLGFFIAKTLLERIGATISVANLGGAGGATVQVSWPRDSEVTRGSPVGASQPQVAL
jgi:two-component system sensor histidine kinase RegB